MSLPVDYVQLLADIKGRIQAAQVRAAFAANGELIRLYWQVGQLLDRRQAEAGWGAAVIPRLACDLADELPEVKDFSERNFKRMLAFFRAYADEPVFLTTERAEKVPQLVAQMAGAEKGCRRFRRPLQSDAYLRVRILRAAALLDKHELLSFTIWLRRRQLICRGANK